jgi:hypothetical protein
MKKSFLEEFKGLQDKLDNHAENYNSHFLIAVDIEEDGSPNASIMMSHGTPFNTLGMIDLLIKNLQDVKEDILDKLSTKSQRESQQMNAESLIDTLPKNIRDKVRSIKERMDKAMEEKDHDELLRIKKEILDLKNPFSSDDDDDEDNFNINDFKGGMA